MAKKEKTPVSAAELTFIRSLEAKDADGNVVVTLIAQPYCVGMYIVQNGQQGSTQHKAYWKSSRKAIAAREKDGLTVVKQESKYTDFLSVEEIENYILKP